MIEAKVVEAASYDDLIEEVFIKPIRTVVVVDDEFPTVDALLDKEMGSAGSWARENVGRARKIIESCRSDTRRWVVDIHDGQNLDALEADNASHFHHSDLMILDYHLNKDRPDDGGDAISILRQLAGNDHFNLVIVYTKGYGETGGEIARVVREVAIGLCSSDERLIMHEKSLQSINGFLEEWEDSHHKIKSDIFDSIDDGVYLKVRALDVAKVDWAKISEWPEFQRLKALVDDGPKNVQDKFQKFAQLALHWRQESLAKKLADKPYGALGWDFGGDPAVNWIRTDRLFVTVVSKTEEPATLPGKLLTALTQWNPEPHRDSPNKSADVLKYA